MWSTHERHCRRIQQLANSEKPHVDETGLWGTQKNTNFLISFCFLLTSRQTLFPLDLLNILFLSFSLIWKFFAFPKFSLLFLHDSDCWRQCMTTIWFVYLQAKMNSVDHHHNNIQKGELDGRKKKFRNCGIYNQEIFWICEKVHTEKFFKNVAESSSQHHSWKVGTVYFVNMFKLYRKKESNAYKSSELNRKD